MPRRTLLAAVATAMLVGGIGVGAPAALAHQKNDDFTLNGRITDLDHGRIPAGH